MKVRKRQASDLWGALTDPETLRDYQKCYEDLSGAMQALQALRDYQTCYEQLLQVFSLTRVDNISLTLRSFFFFQERLFLVNPVVQRAMNGRTVCALRDLLADPQMFHDLLVTLGAISEKPTPVMITVECLDGETITMEINGVHDIAAKHVVGNIHYIRTYLAMQKGYLPWQIRLFRIDSIRSQYKKAKVAIADHELLTESCRLQLVLSGTGVSSPFTWLLVLMRW